MVNKMKRIKGFIKRNYLFIISFFLTLFLYFLILIFNRNLSNETILYSDMYEQYSVFFNYLRDSILNKAGLFNSFSFSLGQNFYGILTYFCISPLNLILLFSSSANMPYFILILVLLKFGLASGTMSIYLKSKYGNNLFIILFSLLYGLMAYNLTYYVNIMWLDCVYLLPLIILGFEKLIKSDKSLLYIITLTLAIITNYYIAFSICIFLIIYFIYYILLNRINKVKKQLLKFARCSIIAVLLSSIVLIPTVFNMLDGKFVNTTSTVSFSLSYNPFYLIYKFIVGDNKILLSDLPLITSSIVVLVLLITYIFNKNFTIKDKFVTISTIIVLLLITLFPALDTIMHCFRIPNQFTYRYGFIISFFLITVAYKNFEKRNYINKRNILIYFIISFLVLAYLKLYIAFKTIITVIILVIYFTFILFVKNNKILLIAILPFFIMELSINIATSINEGTRINHEQYFSLLKYQDKIDKIKPTQNEFYRISGNNIVTYNDSFNLNYYGVSSFSPTISINANKFLKDYLGLALDNSYAIEYVSNTKFTDALLGLKYTYLITDNDLFINENKYYFPVFFSLNKNSNFEINASKIENQNNLYKYLTNSNDNIFLEFEDYQMINCRLEDNKIIQLETYYCDIEAKEKLPNFEYYVEIKAHQNLVPIYDYTETNEQYGTDFILNINDIATIYMPEKLAAIDSFKAYRLDLSKLELLNQILNENALNIEAHNNNRIIGHINNNAENKIMFTTIPYDNGWHVIINGKEIETFKNIDSLLAFDLSVGNLEIELYFIPKGFYLGLGISIGTVIALVCSSYTSKKKNNINKVGGSVLKKIKTFLKLIRLKHYIKNILLFVPLFFAHKMTKGLMMKEIIAFFSFSFMASTIYIINDIKDVNKDRLHPTKRNRPIASGDISVFKAIVIAFVMGLLSLLLNYFTDSSSKSYLILILYFILNIGYSFRLKHEPIFDIFLLASFYILRLYYGGVVVDVNISDWLFLTVMSASFFLTFGKRRNELMRSSDKTRSVLKYYNKDFLDKFMYLSLTLTLVFYSIWTIEQEKKYLIISIPILFAIFFKYALNVEGESDGDPIEVLLKDKLLISLCILYMGLMYGLMR